MVCGLLKIIQWRCKTRYVWTRPQHARDRSSPRWCTGRRHHGLGPPASAAGPRYPRQNTRLAASRHRNVVECLVRVRYDSEANAAYFEVKQDAAEGSAVENVVIERTDQGDISSRLRCRRTRARYRGHRCDRTPPHQSLLLPIGSDPPGLGHLCRSTNGSSRVTEPSAARYLRQIRMAFQQIRFCQRCYEREAAFVK
jgi:hypothetical protein